MECQITNSKQLNMHENGDKVQIQWKTLMIKLYRCPNPQLKLKCLTTLKLNVYMIVKTDKNKD